MNKNYIYYLMTLTLISVFVSKAIFNILIIICFLVSVIYFIKEKKIIKVRLIQLYIVLLLIGMLINSYHTGFLGVLSFLSEEKQYIYFFIIYILCEELSDYEMLEKSIFIGALLSLVYSTISFFTPDFIGTKNLYLEYQKTNKMSSFQNGLRWGRLLSIVVSFNFIKIGKIKIKKIPYLLIFSVIIWNIVINGQRAAILSSFIGLFILFYFYFYTMKKNRIIYILIIFTFFLFLGTSIVKSNKMIKTRVQSIFDLNDNISNKVRLGYLKVGIDMLKENLFLGVGAGNIGDWKNERKFKDFIKDKPKSYREKYIKYHEGVPFENSYLNLAVENGIMFFCFYAFIQLYILIYLIINFIKENDEEYKVKLMVIISTFISDRIYIFFYPGTDSYVEFLIIYLVSYGFKIGNRKKMDHNKKIEVKC